MNQPDAKMDQQMQLLSEVAAIIRETLQLPGERPLAAETELLGAMPEFDSMSVVTVLTSLEDQYGFFVDDDEISAEIFATVGTLVAYVQEKLEN